MGVREKNGEYYRLNMNRSTKTPKKPKRKPSRAPQPRKPNALPEKQTRWQRIVRYVWDKKRGS